MSQFLNLKHHFVWIIVVALALALALLLALAPSAHTAWAQGQPPAVRAVMFHSELCGHCKTVLNQVLPPLQAQYGARLDVRLVETTPPTERALLRKVALSLGVASDQIGVPLLVIGDRYLLGSDQIARELPGLIDKGLAAGGVDFPKLDGLEQAATWPRFGGERPPSNSPPLGGEGQTSNSPSQGGERLPSGPPSQGGERPPSNSLPLGGEGQTSNSPSQGGERLPSGPPSQGGERLPSGPPSGGGDGGVPPQPWNDGFTLAVVIMLGMVVALVYVGWLIARGVRMGLSGTATLGWALPVVALVGLAVAGYLAYVETRAVAAICGPVGDCNAVQSSPYAKLFGIPVGVIGMLGYVGILLAWAVDHWGRGRLAALAPLAVFGMALFGVLFSLYLTFLEPFVIGAVCIWCLSSAALITLVMLLSARPALVALAQTSGEEPAPA